MMKKKKGYSKEAFLAMSIFAEILWIVALPVVLFTIAGKYLDSLFGYKFLFILVGGVLGISTAMFAVYKKTKTISSRIDSLDKDNMKNNLD